MMKHELCDLVKVGLAPVDGHEPLLNSFPQVKLLQFLQAAQLIAVIALMVMPVMVKSVLVLVQGTKTIGKFIRIGQRFL